MKTSNLRRILSKNEKLYISELEIPANDWNFIDSKFKQIENSNGYDSKSL